MTEPNPLTSRALAEKWLSSLGMGLVAAYSAHPFLTVLLQLIDGQAERIGSAFMPLLLAGLVVIFIIVTIRLLPRNGVALRIELGLWWSGGLMWLTIPVLMLITWAQAIAENGDHGGAAAAFFALIIFGGYSFIIGTILLVIAAILRRQRLNTPA